MLQTERGKVFTVFKNICSGPVGYGLDGLLSSFRSEKNRTEDDGKCPRRDLVQGFGL